MTTEMQKYHIGKIVLGTADEISAAYARFAAQKIDETRLADSRECPFGARRRTLAGEAKVTDVGTFDGRANQTVAFAPSPRPGSTAAATSSSPPTTGPFASCARRTPPRR